MKMAKPKKHSMDCKCKTNECHFCKTNFIQKDNKRNYMKRHGDRRSFKCETCGKKFKRKQSRDDHMKTHTGEKPFECAICEMKFGFKKTIIKHMMVHTGEKPFKCEICEKKFATKQNRDIHMKTHNGEKPFKCEICRKAFTTKQNLNFHIKAHTGEKIFKCDICEKKFAIKQTMINHMIVHTGEKRFKCEICEKKFTTKQNKNFHVKTHTGEKSFKCEICEKKFAIKQTMINHLRKHAGKEREKSFKCEICDKKFAVKSNLMIHSKIHTGEKLFNCKICQMKFTRKHHLEVHNITHTGERSFKCNICGKKFTRKQCLTDHLKIHTGEKPFKCEICKMKFTLKGNLVRHSRTHTGEKQFGCEMCEMKFTRKRNLISHLRIHAGEGHKTDHTGRNEEDDNVKVEYHHLHTEDMPDLVSVKSENDLIISLRTHEHSQSALIPSTPKLPNNVDNIMSTNSLNIHNDTITQLKEESGTEWEVSNESDMSNRYQSNEREWLICNESNMDNRVVHKGNARAIATVIVHRNQVVKELQDKMSTNPLMRVEYHHLHTEDMPDLAPIKSENDSIISLTHEHSQSALIPSTVKLPSNVDNIICTNLLNVHNDTITQLKEESGTEWEVSNESDMKNRVMYQSNGREWLICNESNMDNRVVHKGNAKVIDTVTVHRNQVVKELQGKMCTNSPMRVEYHHLHTEDMPDLVSVKSENDSIISLRTHEHSQSTLIPSTLKFPNNVDNIICTNSLNVHNDTITQLKEESRTEWEVSNRVTYQSTGREWLICNESNMDNRVVHKGNARAIDTVTVHRNEVVKELQDKMSTNPLMQEDNDFETGDHDFPLLPIIDLSSYFR